MNSINKAKAVGVALGFALFVAVGLIALVAAELKPAAAPLQAGPIDPAVVASAEQLGKAFTMVANHVKPAVVSVYSEKNITFSQPEFPFGNDFFHQFFGGQMPQTPQARQFHGEQRGMGSGMILDRGRPHTDQLPCRPRCGRHESAPG